MKGNEHMEKNIKIAELVSRLSNLSEAKRVEYLKSNIKSENYVPWTEKVALAKNIVNATTYKLKEKEDKKLYPTSVIQVNSNDRFVFFVMKVIDRWTNIELSENVVEDFDNLNKLGAVDTIMSPDYNIIPARELNEFNVILKNCYDDALTNAYEPHAYISNQITRVTDVAKVLIEPLVEKINNMDEKQLNKALDKLDKIANKLVK